MNFSRTSHAKTIPAISRSLIVIVPEGFDAELNLLCICVGHGNLHTQYSDSICDCGIQTPPTPDFEESTYPMCSGFLATNCKTDVGV